MTIRIFEIFAKTKKLHVEDAIKKYGFKDHYLASEEYSDWLRAQTVEFMTTSPNTGWILQGENLNKFINFLHEKILQNTW